MTKQIPNEISEIYRCPATSSEITFSGFKDSNGFPINGKYINVDNTNSYKVENRLPDFSYPLTEDLPSSDKESLNWYHDNADDYDNYLPLTFKTFNTDENNERKKLIDLLDIKGSETVLEFGCGSGRDSERIARRLNSDGRLYLQDISSDILQFAIDKFNSINVDPQIYISIANGYYLPFADKSFDRVFHFGGLNTFGDIKRTFSEIVRVSKVGAKIVVGDESIPAWLRDSDFGKILMNSNPHYKFELPLSYLPVEARNVKIEWIIGGVFYVISFEIGEGEPYADFDFPIPGGRGGTHRTRYYGQIEGVSNQIKEMAKTARKKSGKSMFNWLEEAIKEKALNDLKDEI